MKSLKYGTLILMSTLTMLSGCEKEEQVLDQYSNSDLLLPKTLVSESVYNSRARVASDGVDYGDFEAFAKILAGATESADFRAALKEEALKKFDGDYDILYTNIRGKNIKGKQFDAYLDKGETLKQATIEAILEKNPLLNIAIPLHSEKWNTSKHSLLVAALDSEESPVLKAFDSQGKVYYIKHDVEPNVPVIVVGYNERVKTIKSTKAYDFIKNDVSRARVMNCIPPYRQDSNYERLRGMRFSEDGLQQVESWSRGAPEIVLHCYAPVNSNNFTQLTKIGDTQGYLEPDKRNDIKDQWWWGDGGNLNVALFPWIRSVNTRSVMFYFWEWDGWNGSREVTLSDVFKLPSQDGSPESTTTLTVKVNMPGGSKDITKPVIDQDICPPFTEGVYGVYGGNNFKWAIQSN